MSRLRRLNFRQIFLILLLVLGMSLSYLAGTISVEANFALSETRATTNQIAAVSSAVSLLLLGNGTGDTLFLPLIMN